MIKCINKYEHSPKPKEVWDEGMGGQKDMGMWVCVGDGKQKRKGTYIFKSNSNITKPREAI